MPIGAIVAPLVLSWVVKIGVRLAAKAAKSALEAAPAAAPSRVSSGETFAAVLDSEQARLPVSTAAVVPPTVPPQSSPEPLGRLAHERGLRSLALGAQMRAGLALPGGSAGQSQRVASAYDRPV